MTQPFLLSSADDTGLKQVELSSAVHLAFHELEFGDLPRSLAVGAGDVIAALTAAWSLRPPLAKEAAKPERARFSHGSRSTGDFLRIMGWKAAIISRASTSRSAPPSIAATVMLEDRDHQAL
jgi:hypothetical protein